MKHLSKQNNNYYLVISFLLGIAIFILIYGLKPLNVTYDAWIYKGYIETDIIQHYSGWLAYRLEDSFFPLTFSNYINYPFGDYTSLSDSVPIAMLFFKIFSPFLPDTFQFLGILSCLNMALQSLFGAKLVSLFTKNKISIIISGIIFCFSPILLERIFRHTSLSCHWLLLYAIYLYIKGIKTTSNVSIAFLFISVLSTLVHLYFTPMIIGLFLAYVLDNIVNMKKFNYKNFFIFILSIILSFYSCYTLGILNIGLGNTSGYGTMGMNLNALFNPVSLGSNWWVPGQGKIDWSLLLPIRALGENNIESFNYLGIGILLALTFFVVYSMLFIIKSRGKVIVKLKTFICKSFFLYLFIIFSFLFSISNRVYAFSYKIFDFTLPQKVHSIFSAFRASGRLFWSVNYMLVLLCIIFILYYSKNNTKKQILFLIIILTIQIFDMYPALNEKHNSFNTNYDYIKSDYVEYTKGNNALFFLEIFEQRETTALLLKEKISNNLLLISRDGYGIKEMDEEINAVRENLLNNVNPYENTTYTTTDEYFIWQLKQNNHFEIEQLEDRYFIYPVK